MKKHTRKAQVGKIASIILVLIVVVILIIIIWKLILQPAQTAVNLTRQEAGGLAPAFFFWKFVGKGFLKHR